MLKWSVRTGAEKTAVKGITEGKMGNCFKCGAPLKPESRFCMKCGAQVETAQPQYQQPQQPPPAPQPGQGPQQNVIRPPHQAGAVPPHPQFSQPQTGPPRPMNFQAGMPPAYPAGFAEKRKAPGGIIAMAGAAIAALGCFLPWIDGGEISTVWIYSEYGGVKDGMIVIILAGIALAMCAAMFLGKKGTFGAVSQIIIGTLMLIIAVFNIIDIMDTNVLNPGYGLFVIMTASVIVILGGAVGLTKKRAY